MFTSSKIDYQPFGLHDCESINNVAHDACPILHRVVVQVMRGKLRMIDGKELYDLSVDPGQTTDIADTASHELLAELREAYLLRRDCHWI